VDCPALLPGVAPIVPAAAPGWVEVCEPVVLGLTADVAAPVPVLLPPMPDPVDPAVCAPAQANAPSRIGAVSHVRFICVFLKVNRFRGSAFLLRVRTS